MKKKILWTCIPFCSCWNWTNWLHSGGNDKFDGTFRTRYYGNGTWAESDSAIGTYELTDKTIRLLFSPSTADEYKFVVQLVKLDERHLWFKHSLFVETEYHLEEWLNSW